MEEKDKCAALYEAATGIQTPSWKWNPKAAEILLEMFEKIKGCTRGMALAKAVWPSSHKLTKLWLAGIPYEIIKNEIKMEFGGKVNILCAQVGIGSYESSIFWALNK